MATQIKTRQIGDGQITKEKIAAGAAIESSKLEDGGNFVKKDGTVPFTGNVDAGNQKVINVQTPSNGNDAVNKTYVDTQIGNLSSLYKYRNARTASVSNINLAAPGATINGVTMVVDDRFLAKDQTAPAENGIYLWKGAAVAAVRASDADQWAELPGSLVSVNEGTVNPDTKWFCTSNDGGTLGTTAVVFVQDTSTGLVAANFVDQEIPSGAINGSNVTYTLANAPTANTEHVYVNGVLQERGAGNDYTISGAVITMLTGAILLSGDKIRVTYRK